MLLEMVIYDHDLQAEGPQLGQKWRLRLSYRIGDDKIRREPENSLIIKGSFISDIMDISRFCPQNNLLVSNIFQS